MDDRHRKFGIQSQSVRLPVIVFLNLPSFQAISMTLTASFRLLKDACHYLPDLILYTLSGFSAWQGHDRSAMTHPEIWTTLTNQFSASQKQHSSHLLWIY